ncbi:hypothetical protein ACHAXA_004153 [Cyclostephanos tholiformis]|uniref:KOW domain-containing protein n=1 Tax=Cyclostephanos tholiformis TaxID=382380 RepID=A0ABD3RBU5_9STRA
MMGGGKGEVKSNTYIDESPPPIDDQSRPLPCPVYGRGWTVISVPRKRKKGVKTPAFDRFWTYDGDPTVKFRSTREVERYLEGMEEGGGRGCTTTMGSVDGGAVVVAGKGRDVVDEDMNDGNDDDDEVAMAVASNVATDAAVTEEGEGGDRGGGVENSSDVAGGGGGDDREEEEEKEEVLAGGEDRDGSGGGVGGGGGGNDGEDERGEGEEEKDDDEGGEEDTEGNDDSEYKEVIDNQWYRFRDETSCVERYARALDVEVLRYQGKEEDEGKDDDKNDDRETKVEEEVQDDHIDLTGARVMVNAGKFKGCIVKINARQSYRHLLISDASHSNESNVKLPVVELVKIADVEIVTPAAIRGEALSGSSFARALMTKYVGARVRILPSNPKYAGVIGTVAKVIVGDWYITDNPEITNAFRADKFDILSYPPGYARAKRLLEEGNRTGQEMRRSESKKMRVELREKLIDDEKEPAEKEIRSSNIVQKIPPIVVEEAPTVMDATSEPDSLARATILITKGRFTGQTGVIIEKRSLRRLQLDTVPDPLGFEDVTVLEYADNARAIESGASNVCTPKQTDFAQRYQRYMGARVKVKQEMQPREYAGVEGTVIRVFVLGDWYVTDNPDVPAAFTRDMFEVIKYPPAFVESSSNDGIDENKDAVKYDDAHGKEEGVIDNDKHGVKYDDVHEKEEVDKNLTWNDEDKDNDESLKENRELDNDEKEDVSVKSNNDSSNTGGEYDPGSPVHGSSNDRHDAENSLDKVVAQEKADFDAHNSNANNEDQEKDSAFDPIVGASVYIDRGKYEGRSGTIIDRKSRGWCTVSGIPSKVQVNQFALVDDGKVDLDKVKAFSQRYPCVMPRVMKSEAVKRKISATHSTGDGGYARSPTKYPHISNMLESAEPTLLDPILLQGIPAILHHLPPDTKIDIFNRRTGKIMKGEDAILLKDLSNELMAHAEYEPIIPPPSSNKSRITSRIGRSSPNVRVNSGVVPQNRVRASMREGRKVLVIGGEYRGLSGIIDSCIPGGWYLVKDLFRNVVLNVVLNMRDLALIPENVVADTPDEGQEELLKSMKTRIHLKAAKLRLDAVIEERERLAMDRQSERTRALMNKLDEDIDEMAKQIVILHQSLDLKGDVSPAPTTRANIH